MSNEDDPLVDAAAFAELQGNVGAEFVPELVAEFIAEAPLILAEMRQTLAAHVTFCRGAHTLKSNGMTFGAFPFAALARALEHGDRDSPARLAELEQAFAQLAARLQELGDGR